MIFVITVRRYTKQVRQWVRRAPALAVFIGALAGCGGGSSPADIEEQPLVTTTGRVYPAASGLVMVEYGRYGGVLQRSTATADDGTFQFSKRLSGVRIEAQYTPSPDRVQPVYSARLPDPETITQLEITPLTTWYDQLLVGGQSSADAAGLIQSLVATNCPALVAPLDQNSLAASATMPGPDHDWLLAAAAAYMQAARKLGVGPKVDFKGWASALERHGDTLSQLCAFSAAISAPEWAAAQADRLKQDANVDTPDAARLATSIAGARAQGLSMLALQIQQSEFPGQTVLLQAAANVTGRELTLGSDFVLAQYQLLQAPAKTAQELVALPTRTSVALTPSGTLVTALQGSTTATGSGAPSLRLVNQGTVDKTLHLAINGQDMTDLAGIIQEIVAMPVAYSGEPPYRRAWRYLMAHKRNTQPLVRGFFELQPDLWLHSVGSSYCEAQSSVLYRIWTAMGYQARVHALTGHVTVEILIDGRWQIFDPYLQAYYTDRRGQVVGVAELEQDPSLITHPQTPLESAIPAAYSAKVAGIFSTTGDNYIGLDYMGPQPEPLDNQVQVPAGGWLEVDARTDVTLASLVEGTTTDMSTMRLWVPPGYTGTLRLPLLLLDVQGAGSVTLFGRAEDDAGNVIANRGLAGLGSMGTSAADPSVGALLQWFYFNDSSDIGVTDIRIDSSGADGLLLTLMVNPLYFKNQQQLSVRVYGTDIDGLRFVAPPAP